MAVYKGAYGRMISGNTACPAIQKKMKMGIVCDAGFYAAIAGANVDTAANDLKVLVLVQNIHQVREGQQQSVAPPHVVFSQKKKSSKYPLLTFHTCIVFSLFFLFS